MPTVQKIPYRVPVPAILLGVALITVLGGVGAAIPQAGEQPPAKAVLVAAPEFAGWPKDQKPEAVVIISGQTYGYLQPCGCSRPQLGGLERRANFIASLKAAGWPVAAVDLGDILPTAGVVPEQVLMKYTTTMNALREMGYVAVGLGTAEFTNWIFRILGEYAVKKEQPPIILSGNTAGVNAGRLIPRKDAFAGIGNRPMIDLTEIVDVGTVPVSVTGVVGLSVAKAVGALGPDTLVGFFGDRESLQTADKELAASPRKPQLNILLFQGTLAEAQVVAKGWPSFQVIVCLSTDSEPPEAPTIVAGANGQKTQIIQVGHKGRYVGVLGAFKTADGKLDLKYHVEPLGEKYLTPGDEAVARTTNAMLPLLEEYASRVKSRNLMGKFPQGPHPTQAKNPTLNLSFVGSDKCMSCHAAEYAVWKQSGHGHAMEALETVAKRPSLRNFDGECVVCHSVGFGFKTGYRDAITTAHLQHVGCESCHGPGAGHVANPKDAKLLSLQSPWRQEPSDRLPNLETMEKLAKLPLGERSQISVTAGEKRMLQSVSQTCSSCHDTENDPNFDLVKYWPKIHHAAKK